MKVVNTIPAGLRLAVTSWENDGDNYRTLVTSGLTKDQLLMYVDLCQLLNSGSELGNLYEPDDSDMWNLANAFLPVLQTHLAAVATMEDVAGPIPAIATSDLQMEEDSDRDEVVELFFNLYYPLFGASEHYSTRVFSSATVELIPSPIEIEVVTDQFFC